MVDLDSSIQGSIIISDEAHERVKCAIWDRAVNIWENKLHYLKKKTNLDIALF